MGRKKGKENKLLLAEPEDLQALIERAQQANGVMREKYTAPAWYQVGRLWREDPCQWAGCRHYHHPYPMNRWGAAAILILCGAAAAGGVMIWFNIALFWHFLLFIPAFFVWLMDKKSFWRGHELDLRQRLQEKTEQSPAEIVVKYLSTELEGSRRQLLGEVSPLRELQKKLRERMEGVEATCQQLAVRVDRRSGTHQQVLVEARQKMQALIGRLRAGLEQIGSHIASIEAFLRECEAQIQALKEPLDDLPLLEQAASHEAGAEQELGQLEGVIMDSVLQLQSRMGEMQTRISVAMAEPAKQLFLTSDGADLEADLERYELAASAAFPSELSPPAGVKL